MYAYIADITTPQERTRRLAILDSFIPLGLLASMTAGAYIRTEYGFTVVFAISTATSLLALLYTVICVVDSCQHSDYKHPATAETAGNVTANHEDQRAVSCASFYDILLGSLQTLKKQRPEQGRRCIVGIVIIFSICYMIELGDMYLWYMFFRLQYKMTDLHYSYLNTYFVILWFFSQALLIPFLSANLRIRDTSIMMVASVLNIAGGLIIMVGHEVWVVFISYTAYILYYNLTALTRNIFGSF